ncbi:MAG: Hpt domain-containing protein [Ruminococcus sp.]|nr:Hpt domain-containing protein [Ruminococcus sp.]MDE6672026.1 Hpt domain-containing protein [Ruminococcus sp.]
MTLQECYSIIGDYKDVAKRLPLDRMITKFVLKFLDDKSYEKLVSSIASADYKEAFMAAHTLKGVCQNLSFTKLYEPSHIMTETLRNENPDMATVTELLEKIRVNYELTTETIKNFRDSQ